MKLTNKLGMQLLGVWLIMTGLMQVVSIPIPNLATILAVVAVATGAIILLGK
jgi:hypothetical protein